jgi:hypothetical protein
MVSDILALLDRLTQLKDYRNRRYRTLFVDLLEPAFNDLLLVHKDYIQMFEETRRLLPIGLPEATSALGYLTELKRPAEFLRSRRIEFEPVRQKLRTLAKSIDREHLEPDIAAFIQALVAYFYEFLPQIGSASVDLLERLERSIERGLTSQEDLLNEWRSIDTIHQQLSRTAQGALVTGMRSFRALEDPIRALGVTPAHCMAHWIPVTSLIERWAASCGSSSRGPWFAPAALGSRLYSESPVALGINEVSMK